MRRDTEELIEYLEANPQLRPWQAICDFYNYDVVLGWKVPQEVNKIDTLVELSKLGIEDTFYL